MEKENTRLTMLVRSLKLAQIKPVEKSLTLLASIIPEKAKRCVERELDSKNGYQTFLLE